jgi:outer membrane protein assembly factor BamB
LLEKWSSGGPPLVWKSEQLPFGPTCGVGSPVVAGGNVYTYAQIGLPIDGIKPFSAEFMLRWGYVAEMTPELRTKIENALKDPKFAASKNIPDQLEAFTKDFLGTLDAAEAKQFGDAVRNRFKYSTWWTADHLAWMATYMGKEIKSRQDFLNLFIDRLHNYIYHGPNAVEIYKHADEMYKDQKWADVLYCLDGASGKILWSKELPGVKKFWGVEFGCSGVPAVVKDRIYFAGSGGVYCLDLKKKGELIWQAKGAPSHTSPLVADGVVYCCPGELAAFNADTGAELWRQPTVTGDSDSPVLWKNEGKSYVLCASAAPHYNFNTYCVDAQTGKILWKQPNGGEHTALLLQGDTLISRGNGVTAYHLTPAKPEQLWVSKLGGDYGGSPIIYDDHVYNCGLAYGTILVIVLDLKTGAAKLTQTKTAGGGACSSGIAAGGKIIFISESNYKTGRLIVFNANPEKYEEVGQLPNPDVVASTSPAFADGKVYVRMATAIACYDIADHGQK